ncbi:MAG: hypothetical protein ABH803_03075 [Candidatus Micrarchaeota archaeon]
MKTFIQSISKQKHVVHATFTREGVPAVHLKKIPFYRLKRVCDNQGLVVYSIDDRRHHHLYIRNSDGELIATLINNDLILLPKNLRNKQEAFELINTLVNYREGKKTR